MKRTATYDFVPTTGVPHGLSIGGNIEIDTRGVAHCAVKEILLTRMQSGAVYALLDDLLAPSPEKRLVWKGPGPGLGRELKRGFSAIFGRFFARWYLETHHGFRHFLPIEGSPCTFFSKSIKIERKNDTMLPDWLMVGREGLALGEAKGSYSNVSKSAAKAGPLKHARNQLEQAELHVSGKVAKVPGYAAMTRWSSELTAARLPPLLYALKTASTGGRDPTVADNITLIKKVADLEKGRLLRALGFSEFDKLLAEEGRDLTGLDNPRKIEPAYIGIDGLAEREFVGAIVDGSAVPLQADLKELVSMRGRMPLELIDRLYFVGYENTRIFEDPINPAEFGFQYFSSDTSRSVSLSDDGFLLAPFSTISDVK